LKAHLLHRERNFELPRELPEARVELAQDLQLDAVLEAMANSDRFLLEVARKVLLTSLERPDEIVYRQHILADCMKQPTVIREMYSIAGEAIEREKKVWGWTLSRYPESLLHRSVEVLKVFSELLGRLRRLADRHHARFQSEGLKAFAGMLMSELSDEYLAALDEHLRRLQFRDGILISAELLAGNRIGNFVLRKAAEARQNLLTRIQGWVGQIPRTNKAAYVYEVADRDEAGIQVLSALRGHGVSLVASALGQSVDHVRSFFEMLHWELGFYTGCLNLRDRLVAKGEPLCFPEVLSAEQEVISARALYDVSLSLRSPERVVGNAVRANHKRLVLITGANRGGKSTLLRAIGEAQLMLQCGMFVPAEYFSANVCTGLFSHFKREEDDELKSGKLDEELRRMSAIVDRLVPGAMVLMNESFAATNEREGSEIAGQVVRGLLESNIKLLYVTHLTELAQRLHGEQLDIALFMRAERLSDGTRTFRLLEGEPLPTSYGPDLYRKIFDETAPIEQVKVSVAR